MGRWIMGIVWLAVFMPSIGWAGCEVQTSAANYATGTNLSGDICGATGGKKVELSSLISGEDQTYGLLKTSGGQARQTTVASAVTTNTTSTAIALPTGLKTFYGQVVGTGSVTQTQAIYGDVDNDAANGVLLCTITLSGTTRTQDTCLSQAAYSFYYVITTATTGTSATGAVYAMY